jgi:polysaccharide export outer membrane protein
LALGDIGGKQQISGQHLVTQDGTVTLGTYGSVLVIGQTLAEAKASIERHLSQFLEEPEVSVDVYAYNSKNFYVITQGAQLGDGVSKFPITGNETVLDAISQINGLTSVSSTKIWIARPGQNAAGCDQLLPVDWIGLTQRGDVTTNYQLMPGDRVYVADDKLVATDNYLAKLISPIERVFGITLLGSSTIFSVKRGGNFGGGGGF